MDASGANRDGCLSTLLCMRLDCIGLDAVEIVLAAVVKGRMGKKKKERKKDQVLQFITTVRYLCHGCDRKSNKLG